MATDGGVCTGHRGAEPQAAAEALRRIGALYKIEQEIRSKALTGQAKRQHRLTHSKPHVDSFFAGCPDLVGPIDRQLAQQVRMDLLAGFLATGVGLAVERFNAPAPQGHPLQLHRRQRHALFGLHLLEFSSHRYTLPEGQGVALQI